MFTAMSPADDGSVLTLAAALQSAVFVSDGSGLTGVIVSAFPLVGAAGMAIGVPENLRHQRV